jgi:hypothetical protein
MNPSAFDVLIVPVFCTTLVACIAGAAIFALMNLAEALVVRLRRTTRAFKALREARRHAIDLEADAPGTRWARVS